jgi:hypothetical protein
MRGRLAAACAAVLVGLAPAGALPFASYAAAAAVSVDRAAQRAEVIVPRTPQAKPAVTRASGEQPREARVLTIFRSPSGPAPSRAPPA